MLVSRFVPTTIKFGRGAGFGVSAILGLGGAMTSGSGGNSGNSTGHGAALTMWPRYSPSFARSTVMNGMRESFCTSPLSLK